jgi:cbb3-type cytochrome oxidase cytochrome c subunit
VFIREGCVSCHRFNDLGGGPGPDLTGVASRMSPAAMRAQIRKPSAGNPASRMPAFPAISWFDVRSLVAFLRG